MSDQDHKDGQRSRTPRKKLNTERVLNMRNKAREAKSLTSESRP